MDIDQLLVMLGWLTIKCKLRKIVFVFASFGKITQGPQIISTLTFRDRNTSYVHAVPVASAIPDVQYEH